jgi:Ribonuclease G/E
MSDELLINVTPMECRVALIENGTVNELFIERTAKRGLVGNIYKGKVVRVLPGMQAAFVDIGLSRTAFLHINDMVWPRSQPTPNVFELLHPGQILTVQVMKDMLGTKGARLSTDLSIPSRYLVLMPYGNHIGVSQRIESEEERDRLRNIIESIQAEHNLPGSVIVRTAAEGVDEAEIAQDMCYLSKLWEYIQRKQVDVAVPTPEQQKLGLQGGGFRQFTVRSPYAAHGLLCRIVICHYSQVHRLRRQQRLCHLHFRGQKGPSEVDIPHRRQCASVTAVVPFRRQAVCGQLRQLCLRARYYNHRIKLLKLCCEHNPRQFLVLHAC